MIRYKVLSAFKGKTEAGEIELRPGQVVKLSPSIAARLLDSEKVKPYCYWTEQTVDECRYPCYSFNGRLKVTECVHFIEYWKERGRVG